jgi:thiol:disulfide interchange protein
MRVGWGFQFQDSRFIALISCLVFAFALNLFGIYELSVSTRATGRLAKPASGQGYASAFFQGAFATVLATPCTTPFLGTVSAFTIAQPGWVTFLVFLFIGVGMALPYLVLAINPNWLRYLPKPGGWMVRLKQFMGFLLIATLLWLMLGSGPDERRQRDYFAGGNPFGYRDIGLDQRFFLDSGLLGAFPDFGGRSDAACNLGGRWSVYICH